MLESRTSTTVGRPDGTASGRGAGTEDFLDPSNQVFWREGFLEKSGLVMRLVSGEGNTLAVARHIEDLQGAEVVPETHGQFLSIHARH